MANEINEQELKEFYTKGMLAFEKKNYDYAIEIFSQILSSKYDHVEARHYLHLSLKNKAGGGKPSFVTNALNYANRLAGTMSADSLLKKSDVPGAIEKLEKIIASNPNDIETLSKMADIFYKNGFIANAIQNLEEAKSVNPNDISVLKKLGEIYLKKEDYKNAKSNYDAAIKINPGDLETLRALKNLDALGTIQSEFTDK